MSSFSELNVTREAMQSVIKMCRIHLPSETCGFIVASKDATTLGTRVVWMQNVAEKPERNYSMDHAALRLAYKEFDDLGEEPVAIFHSHVDSEPIMSVKDLAQAMDASLFYVVVSLMDPRPSVRAYTVKHFIGTTEATGVPIRLKDHAPAPAAFIPTGPWALSPGNRVRIGYRRTGKSTISSVVAIVLRTDASNVYLDPDHKMSARMIPLERISSVHVLAEGDAGVAARRELRLQARHVASLLAGHDLTSVHEVIDTLHRAVPPSIIVTMDVPA